MTDPVPYFLADESTFFDEFDPVEIEEESGDYNRDYDDVKDLDEHLVWTVIEGEDLSNSLWAAPGVHHVNRLYYIVAAKPWSEGQGELLWMDGMTFMLDKLEQYEAGDEEWDEAREALRERVNTIRAHIATHLCAGDEAQVDSWLQSNVVDPLATKLAELQPLLMKADALAPTNEEASAFAP